MNASPEKKQRRYQLQAVWTKPFREYIYRILPDKKHLSILEIGCGTGAVLSCIREELHDRIGFMTGVDLDRSVLKFALNQLQEPLVQCMGEKLSFCSDQFDFVYCHYLLLWVKDPASILNEMFRVTKTDGICALMAEPDYEQMTAEPYTLFQLAKRQKQALMAQGACLNIGNHLEELMFNIGFRYFDSGKYKEVPLLPDSLEREISQMLEDCGIIDIDIDKSSKKVYNVPTYYAYGIK